MAKQENMNMETLANKQREKNWTELLSILAFLAALVLFSWFHTGDAAAFQVGETDFTLRCEDGTVYKIPYAEVLSVSCAETADFGTCIDGSDTSAGKSGRWENERWGEYFLCAEGELSACVVVKAQKAIYVFNCESDATTMAIGEELTDWVAQKQAQ